MSRPLLLLVDDAPEIAIIVRKLCQQTGPEVVSRLDAESAWDYLNSRDAAPGEAEPRRPDLLLLDLNLPGLGGIDLCKRVRAEERLVSLPVALFSHWDRTEDIAAALEAGTDYIISKDLLCQPAAWRERIDEILDPAHGRSIHALLSCSEAQDLPPSPEQWLDSLCQAFRHPTVRQLGPEILAVLARRALQQVGSSLPKEWLTADRFNLDFQK